MKVNQHHVLNGDALLSQFPKSILGGKSIARECLVDGPVKADSLEQLYELREEFLKTNYRISNDIKYKDNVILEFTKIEMLDQDMDINLWFEDDLFCQVNLWFVLSLLNANKHQNSLYLVRPPVHTQYGFGALSDGELITCYNNRINIKHFNVWSSLFTEYQEDNYVELIRLAKSFEADYPFVLEAVQAHIQRQPTNESLGRPKDSLIRIISDLQTKSFEHVFKEFCKREAIYGFGDIQVKRLYDQVLLENPDLL